MISCSQLLRLRQPHELTYFEGCRYDRDVEGLCVWSFPRPQDSISSKDRNSLLEREAKSDFAPFEKMRVVDT